MVETPHDHINLPCVRTVLIRIFISQDFDPLVVRARRACLPRGKSRHGSFLTKTHAFRAHKTNYAREILASNSEICRSVRPWPSFLGRAMEICSAQSIPFTPKGDQFQISPAASPAILHHTVWRAWLFIGYSDERLFYYRFSLLHTGWENVTFLSWEWERDIDVAENREDVEKGELDGPSTRLSHPAQQLARLRVTYPLLG